MPKKFLRSIPVIDVTAKSVEETAFLIKEKLDERNEKAWQPH